MTALVKADLSGTSLSTTVVLHESAQRIRDWLRTSSATAIEIGRELQNVKSQLGHGHFLPWVKSECGIGARTAANYMGAAALVSKFASVAILPPSALYLLAARSTPTHVIEEVTRLIAEGGPPSEDAIRQLISASSADLASRAVGSPASARKVAQSLLEKLGRDFALAVADELRQLTLEPMPTSAGVARPRNAPIAVAALDSVAITSPKKRPIGLTIRAVVPATDQTVAVGNSSPSDFPDIPDFLQRSSLASVH